MVDAPLENDRYVVHLHADDSEATAKDVYLLVRWRRDELYEARDRWLSV
jgi:hypothetical protein